MVVQAGVVESSPESSSSNTKETGAADSINTMSRIMGFINNNNGLGARDHRTVTGLIFAGTLVAFWERMGFSIAFTDIATEMRLSETEKGSVFASYYFGFALTQVPGGYLANRYGGKNTLALSFLLWTPASALMALPSGSSDHVVVGVVVCRLVIGMAQGILLPAAQSVLGHWVPAEHRGRYFAFAMSGMFAGAALAMVTVPTVVSDISAPTTFYIAACLGAAWLAVWVCAGSDTPRGGGGEAAEMLDTTQDANGTFSAIHKKPGLEDGGGGRPKDHWAEAGMTLDATPKPWAFINPRLSQSSGLTSASESGTPTGPGPPTIARARDRARASPPTRPKATTGNVVARVCRVRPAGDSARVTCAEEFDGFVSPISRSTVGAGSDSSIIRRAMGGGLCEEPPSSGGESGGESGAAGTTAPATPAETRAKLVRAAFVSGYAVSGSGMVSDTVEDGSGRGSDGKLGLAPCRGGKDRHGAGVGAGAGAGASVDNGCSCGIQNQGDSIFSPTPSRSDLAVEGAAGADTNAPSLCEEGKSAVSDDGRSFSAFNNNLAGGGGGSSRESRWNVREEHVGRSSRRTVSSSSGQTPVTSVSGSSGGSGSSVGSTDNSGRTAVGSENGDKEVGDSIVQAQISPAFSGKDPPPVKDAAMMGKTGAVFGHGSSSSSSSSSSSQVKPSSFPWRAMSVSPAAWACVAGNVGAGTGINVVMSWLPTYFEEFFRVDLEDIGLASLLAPYLTMMAFSILGGVAYCWLTNTRGTSTSRAAKTITGLSFALAVGFFLSMGLAKSPTTGTLLSSLALASVAFSRGGWSTNHVEIAAPEHAAMLYSVANSISSASSVVEIAVTGKILDALGGGGQSVAWVVAMGTIGAICGACGVFFVVFAKGDEVLFPGAMMPGSKDVVVGAGGGGGGRRGGEGKKGKKIKVGPRRDDMA